MTEHKKATNTRKIKQVTINDVDDRDVDVNKLLDAVKTLHSEIQTLRAENKILKNAVEELSSSVSDVRDLAKTVTALNDYTGCGSQVYRSSKSLRLQIVEIERKLESIDRYIDYQNRGLRVPCCYS